MSDTEVERALDGHIELTALIQNAIRAGGEWASCTRFASAVLERIAATRPDPREEVAMLLEKLAEAERQAKDWEGRAADAAMEAVEECSRREAAERALADVRGRLEAVRDDWRKAQEKREQSHLEHGREHDHGYARALASVGDTVDRVLATLDAQPEQPAERCGYYVLDSAPCKLPMGHDGCHDCNPEQPIACEHDADDMCRRCKPRTVERPSGGRGEVEDWTPVLDMDGNHIGEASRSKPSKAEAGELLPLWSRVIVNRKNGTSEEAVISHVRTRLHAYPYELRHPITGDDLEPAQRHEVYPAVHPLPQDGLRERVGAVKEICRDEAQRAVGEETGWRNEGATVMAECAAARGRVYARLASELDAALAGAVKS